MVVRETINAPSVRSVVANNMPIFQFKKDHPDGKVPSRKRTTDAGYDISAVEDATVLPHSTANISTGIKVAAPPGWFYSIEGRSGMGFKGVAPFPGVIDAGYTGLVMVMLCNISDIPYFVKKGDRIAQIVPHQIVGVEYQEVQEFSPEYNGRGEAGFGSSGA